MHKTSWITKLFIFHHGQREATEVKIFQLNVGKPTGRKPRYTDNLIRVVITGHIFSN